MSDDALSQLISMGFDSHASSDALQLTAGNMEQAVNYLLSDPTSNSSSLPNETPSSSSSSSTHQTPPNAASNSILRQGTIHQYNVENGKSACTCMALWGAQTFLQQILSNTNTDDPSTISFINAEFLDDMVRNGSQLYSQYSRMRRQQHQPYDNDTVEHTSVEELLLPSSNLFPYLQMNGSCARQGLLQGDEEAMSHHPLGLYHMLTSCQQDTTEWTCVLLTKPPETILICLPPSSSSSLPFLLLDSHCRPTQNIPNAYCQFHATLADLIHTIQILFPYTDLGPDVPELMQCMYNSFDLYPISLKMESIQNDNDK
jgi:hypothetical protein